MPEDGGLRVAAAHAVSAAAAGATHWLLYPLDTIRIRQQQEATLRQTWSRCSADHRARGRRRALSRGLRSSLGALAANLTYFGAYNALKGSGTLIAA